MRRTMLVKRTLTPNKADRAQVMFWSDVHVGAKTCNEELAKERLDYALKHGIYVIALGDTTETVLKDSKGELYEQRYSPSDQVEKVIEWLTPLAKSERLLGFHSGNHGKRAFRATSIDIDAMMAKELDVPYLDHCGFYLLRVGSQSYTVYATHGSSGARAPYSKIRAALDCFKSVNAEVVAFGHTHGFDHMTQLFKSVDKRSGTIKEVERHAILTGSYLGYTGSYAEEHDLPACRLGSPIVNFHGDAHTIRVVI